MAQSPNIILAKFPHYTVYVLHVFTVNVLTPHSGHVHRWSSTVGSTPHIGGGAGLLSHGAATLRLPLQSRATLTTVDRLQAYQTGDSESIK